MTLSLSEFGAHVTATSGNPSQPVIGQTSHGHHKRLLRLKTLFCSMGLRCVLFATRLVLGRCMRLSDSMGFGRGKRTSRMTASCIDGLTSSIARRLEKRTREREDYVRLLPKLLPPSHQDTDRTMKVPSLSNQPRGVPLFAARAGRGRLRCGGKHQKTFMLQLSARIVD